MTDGQYAPDAWDSTQEGDSLPACVILTLEVELPASADRKTRPSDHVYQTTRYVTPACYRETSQTGTP